MKDVHLILQTPFIIWAYPFQITIQFQTKKSRSCAWDSNPAGQQDGSTELMRPAKLLQKQAKPSLTLKNYALGAIIPQPGTLITDLLLSAGNQSKT